jgi:hypothetical protein
MDLDMNHPDSYRVEVSGWDARENFFIEKTVLQWKAEDKKAISLRAAVAAGCVLFVRLLQPLASAASFPVAYQVLAVSERDGNGAITTSLERMRPRAAYREAFTVDSLAAQVA